MLTDKVCLCGGYWDWIKEDPQLGWDSKPNLIPLELDDKSKINGWSWEYICNENCSNIPQAVILKTFDDNKTESIIDYFPGGGTSSSSCERRCKTCPPLGSGPFPCGTRMVTLGPPACEDCNGQPAGGTITCELPSPPPKPWQLCSSSSSSSSKPKKCCVCGAPQGAAHNFSCVFRNYTNPNDQCYE